MNRLKELRTKAGISQREFGAKFNASQNTVSNWENGNRQIDNEHLVEFSKFFDVSVDYLLGKDVADVAEIVEGDKKQKFALVRGVLGVNEEEFEEVMQFVGYIKSKNKRGEV